MDVARTHRPAVSAAPRHGIYPNRDVRAALLAIYDAQLAKWPVRFEELDVRTRYGRTHVIAAGDPASPPLLLVHMAGVASFVWRSIVKPLAAMRRVYAVDTIGDLGKSELDDLERHPKNGADYSAWLCDVSDKLGIPAADVVAGSMGGWITMHHAAHAPDRVHRVALLGPMGLPSWPQTLRVLARLSTVGFLPSIAKKERLITWVLGPDRAVRGEVGEWMSTIVDTGCKPRLASPYPVPATTLDRIEAPTLVILGGKDGPIGNAGRAAKRARSHIRDVHVEILEDCGHAMSVEAPERVAPLIVDFLKAPRWPI